MGDVFISYSKADRDKVVLLSALLEAKGYTTWWDTSLLAGDDFQVEIMRQLELARAAIVIWTTESVKSQWVRSEAGRASQQGKLIAVRDNAVEYKDIPPPFDILHTESISETAKIVEAVAAKIANPARSPSLFRVARYEILSWLGIVGAAISLAANLQGVIKLARLARVFVERWTEVVASIWRTTLFFIPQLHTSDALILTALFFMLTNLVLSSRRGGALSARGRDWISCLAAAAVLAPTFAIGIMAAGAAEEAAGHPGLFSGLINDAVIYLTRLIMSIDMGPLRSIVAALCTLLILFILPLAPFLGGYLALSRLFAFRLDFAVLAVRLRRVTIGVLAIIALNYGADWLALLE